MKRSVEEITQVILNGQISPILLPFPYIFLPLHALMSIVQQL